MRTPAVLATAVAVLVAGCGSTANTPANPGAQESSPPGDIPDNQAFVSYAPNAGGFSVKVPEGWSQQGSGAATTFTDKLNSIRVESQKAPAPLTAAGAAKGLAQLGQSLKGFQPGKVTTVSRKAGRAVEMTYLAAAAPNAVTGKAGTDAVERYVFFHNGRRVVLTLSGPKGADNVDPWRIVTDSLNWTR
jgi:hypothetical protein